MDMGTYPSTVQRYSPYAHAMFMEIKDLYAQQTGVNGWDVFKNLFHELWKKPVPEAANHQVLWHWIKDIIFETSHLDIAPILSNYHIPLLQEAYSPPVVEIIAQEDENLLIVGMTVPSSTPNAYNLKGNTGHSIMYSSPRNDTYYGGLGKDEMRFTNESRWQDTFYNFDPLIDHITVGLRNEAIPIIQQDNEDCLFSFENGDSLLLKNITLSQLNSQNMTFLAVSEIEENNQSDTDHLYRVNAFNFEQAKSYMRQFGDKVVLHTGEEISVLPYKKISDFKETDFKYRWQHSEISFDDIMESSQNSESPSFEMTYSMNSCDILDLLVDEITHVLDVDLLI